MRKIVLIFVLIVIFSCEQEESKKPINFIEKDKMIDLIVDMKIADKARTIINKDKKKNLNYMSVVFEKHNIDSLQFKENNAFYTENIELYKEIYLVVQARLKDSVAKYKDIKRVNDSITKQKRKNKSLLDKKNIKKPNELRNKIRKTPSPKK